MKCLKSGSKMTAGQHGIEYLLLSGLNHGTKFQIINQQVNYPPCSFYYYFEEESFTSCRLIISKIFNYYTSYTFWECLRIQKKIQPQNIFPSGYM